MTERKHFLRGMSAGIPIACGYFAVALTLGIAAKRACMSAFASTLTSFLIHASAGEYIGFAMLAAGEGYLTMTVMEAVANARYFLMSCSLSQKLRPTTPVWQRLLLGYGVTDEIFGISIGERGYLHPSFSYGAMAVSLPAWACGTLCGFLLGSVLPARLVSALGVSLYAMFISIFIPKAKADKVVLGLVALSFAASFAASEIPLLNGISDGVKTIVLTVFLSLGAAILFPHDEKEAAQ